MAVPTVDQLFNTLEYFVHHEDIRRADPGWEPRELTDREQRILFKGAATAGKGFVRSVGVPVEIRWTDGERDHARAVRAGEGPATPSVITVPVRPRPGRADFEGYRRSVGCADAGEGRSEHGHAS